MEKKVIRIPRETQAYKCQVCHRMVDVNSAKPWTIETDTTILQTWDYGHQHRKVFDIINGEQFQIEGDY